MSSKHASAQYQRQDVLSASPAQLIAKLYDLAVLACHTGDRIKLRKVLIELISSLNFEDGGDLSVRLSQIYEYCMRESISGDLNLVHEMLDDLRTTWKQGFLVNATAPQTAG
jgi:flagellar secretion chaperone FliS